MTVELFTQFTADYGAWILLPIAIIEGPLATLLGGWMASLGKLSVFTVYGIVILGDIIGDAGIYILGRWGMRVVHPFSRLIGMTSEKKKRVELFFNAHEKKALVFSKIAHGIGITGLLTAGALKIPYIRYARMCAAVSVVQAALFLALGYFFGHAYRQILGALNIASIFVSMGLIVLLFVIIRRFIFRPIESYGAISTKTTADRNDLRSH